MFIDYYPKITRRMNRVNVLVDQVIAEDKVTEHTKKYVKSVLSNLENNGEIMAEIELDKLISYLEAL